MEKVVDWAKANFEFSKKRFLKFNFVATFYLFYLGFDNLFLRIFLLRLSNCNTATSDQKDEKPDGLKHNKGY
ncbi:unnamed protein product [Meloidogyne enterolobii]|uniref:Uncharacterized protein n=1 Tax=Meloidogyne enterolobii TaxID=390850 RepID=A0ACB0Y5N3_MELEN